MCGYKDFLRQAVTVSHRSPLGTPHLHGRGSGCTDYSVVPCAPTLAHCPSLAGPLGAGARLHFSHSASLREDIKDQRDVLFVLFGL